MSEAKKCDRCGKFYSKYNLALEDDRRRYDLTKDCYPYGTIKLDLCKNCKLKLIKWFEMQDMEEN